MDELKKNKEPIKKNRKGNGLYIIHTHTTQDEETKKDEQVCDRQKKKKERRKGIKKGLELEEEFFVLFLLEEYIHMIRIKQWKNKAAQRKTIS